MIAHWPAPTRGALYMAMAAVCWSVMMILARTLGEGFTAFEILFFRNLVAIGFMAPLLVGKRAARLRTRRLPLHVLRAALAYLGMIGLLYGLLRIPVADVVALSFTQPLFITVMAALLLGEAVGTARWRATLIGFVGVLVVLRPGFAEIGAATVAVLASAAFYAASNICIKRLMSTDTPIQSTLYVNVLMLPMSLVPALFFWTTPDAWDLLALLGVGLGGTGGVYLVSRAYATADASAVVPYDFLRLPLSGAAAYILFGEGADIWMIIGAAVIFASSYALVRIEAKPITSSNPTKDSAVTPS